MKNFITIFISIFITFYLQAQCPSDIQPSCPIITGAFMELSDNGDGTSDYTISIEWIQGTADNASIQWDVYSGTIICPEEYDDLGLYPVENCQPVNSNNSSGTIIDFLENVPNTETVYMVAQGRTNGSCGGNKCNQTFLEVAPRPVPVELVYFDGNQNGGHIQLEWETESEVQNEGFLIEESENSNDFQEIGFVTGHGTTTETKKYVYRDKLSNYSKMYYRLKQVDFDGGYTYSKIICIKRTRNIESTEFTLYPNPVKECAVNIEVENYENSSLEVMNNFGKRMLFKNLENHKTQINTNEWPSGIYNVIVIINNELHTQRLIKKL